MARRMQACLIPCGQINEPGGCKHATEHDEFWGCDKKFCPSPCRPVEAVIGTDKPTTDVPLGTDKGPPAIAGPVGWICPVCGRGNSPYSQYCPCKGWPEYRVTTGTAVICDSNTTGGAK